MVTETMALVMAGMGVLGGTAMGFLFGRYWPHRHRRID